jgi:pyruvate dehydrogenase E1 component alpha subunit
LDEGQEDRDVALSMHRQMLRIRSFEEAALGLRANGEIDGVIHPAIGQEAVPVGVCANLTSHDRITSTHRGHGHAIAKGADLNRMMAELFGRQDGYCRGLGGSMHIADFAIGMLGANGIVAAGLPIAAGAALACQLSQSGDIATCFFSDGALGAGPFHEILNMASLWRLPLLLVCENNGWAAFSPTTSITSVSDPHMFGETYGIRHSVVDGNDVEGIYAAATDAVSHVRSGAGPYLLEARTFRVEVHAFRGSETIQDPRNTQLIDDWKERDPIRTHTRYLMDRGFCSISSLEEVQRQVDIEIVAAIEFARQSPQPSIEDAEDSLFV